AHTAEVKRHPESHIRVGEGATAPQSGPNRASDPPLDGRYDTPLAGTGAETRRPAAAAGPENSPPPGQGSLRSEKANYREDCTMTDIETSVHELITNKDRLLPLLTLDKVRRGVAPDALVFVGMANVAEQRWCEQKAVLKSRAMETAMFASYLEDRLL